MHLILLLACLKMGR